MFAIREKKTGLYLMKLLRDDGLSVPDMQLSSIDNAKIFAKRREAMELIDCYKQQGCIMKNFEIVHTWGRPAN